MRLGQKIRPQGPGRPGLASGWDIPLLIPDPNSSAFSTSPSLPPRVLCGVPQEQGTKLLRPAVKLWEGRRRQVCGLIWCPGGQQNGLRWLDSGQQPRDLQGAPVV